MDLNETLLKHILEYINQNMEHSFPQAEINIDNLSTENFTVREINYHIRILYDDRLIEAIDDDSLHRDEPIYVSRLTAEGHRVLEAMKDNSLLQKMKAQGIQVTKETLSSIPRIFIRHLLNLNI